jgi:surface polysaccharide O-acyltransferase-like enzyme
MQMMKRALLLNGVAILGVLVNHALYWMRTALSGQGTPIYYVWLVLQQLYIFSVPAFIFVSGFFLAFTLRGQTRLDPTIMRKRVENLIVPYLVWSVIMIGANIISGQSKSGFTYLLELVSTGVHGPYYFVPLLLQLYLIGYLVSPLIVRYPWRMFSIAVAVQLGTVAIWYLSFWWTSPLLESLQRIVPYWTFFHYLPYFVLGFITCLNRADLAQFVQRHHRLLFAALVLGALGSIIEPEFVSQTYGVEWHNCLLPISVKFYGMAFILWFLSIKDLPKWLTQRMQYLAGKSYGIYLIHGPIGGLAARVVLGWVPWIASSPLVFGTTIFIASLAGSLMLIEGVKNMPVRKAYPILFG